MLEIFLQLINKHTQWTVNRYLQSIVDILLHCVRIAVIFYDAKRFVWTKESVGTRECLNDIHILHHLVNIQCVYPLRIVAGQHLCNHNKQVNLLVMVILYIDVWLFYEQGVWQRPSCIWHSLTVEMSCRTWRCNPSASPRLHLREQCLHLSCLYCCQR